MSHPSRDAANELRAVAPLVVVGPDQQPQLVGPCTLVENGAKTIAFSSSELLREAGEPLAIALTLDGKHLLPILSWGLGRMSGIGVLELGKPFPKDQGLDVSPLAIGSVYASVDTRGAPAALVTITAGSRGFERRVIPSYIDAIDSGGMLDDIVARLASPIEDGDAEAPVDGAALFAWLPPDAVLGRGSEVVVAAVGCTYRAKAFQPRKLPALAELIGLEDLGRALPWGDGDAEGSNELRQVAGEIADEPKK